MIKIDVSLGALDARGIPKVVAKCACGWFTAQNEEHIVEQAIIRHCRQCPDPETRLWDRIDEAAAHVEVLSDDAAVGEGIRRGVGLVGSIAGAPGRTRDATERVYEVYDQWLHVARQRERD